MSRKGKKKQAIHNKRVNYLQVHSTTQKFVKALDKSRSQHILTMYIESVNQ